MGLNKRYNTISVQENIKLRRDLDDQEARLIGQIQDAISGAVVPDADKTLTYNMDGTLNVITDANGTKTMVYTSGKLTSIIGTGAYPSKTFTYTGDLLTGIDVL